MNHAIDEVYRSQTHKLELFQAAYAEVRHLPGDFAEFGVYHGNGTRELASLDRERHVWAFDTFTGMPAEDYSGAQDDSDPVGKWIPEVGPEVLFAGVPNVYAMKGRFVHSLPRVPKNVRFVLCHLDCDWFNSYIQVFNFLAKGRLTPGAILLIDDYNVCTGCRNAVDNWVKHMGNHVILHNGARIDYLG